MKKAGELIERYHVRAIAGGFVRVGMRFDKQAINANGHGGTGQRFDDGAVDALVDWTDGQPWCVNRLCYQAVTRIAPSGKAAVVTKEHIDQACRDARNAYSRERYEAGMDRAA